MKWIVSTGALKGEAPKTHFSLMTFYCVSVCLTIKLYLLCVLEQMQKENVIL